MASDPSVTYEVREKEGNTIKPKVIGRVYYDLAGAKYLYDFRSDGPVSIGKVEVINAGISHLGGEMPVNFVPSRFVAELTNSEGSAINYSADQLIAEETKIVDLEHAKKELNSTTE